MLRNKDHTISFSLFRPFPELLCVMSTRSNGNFWIKNEITGETNNFLNYKHIATNTFVAMEQIHGSNIKKVGRSDGGKVVAQVDGLVTNDRELFLGVNVADCVPLFFYDPENRVVAVVHAGWKGVMENIANKAVKKLLDTGSDPKDILVAIGPHISGCCYVVNSYRVGLFQSLFQDDRVVFKQFDKWYIDLGMANRLQLLSSGILDSHIEAPITCTSCQNDIFFSFRKDSKETLGEMLGVIGIRHV